MTGHGGGSRESSRARTIPEATVARLAVYLRILTGLGEHHAGRPSTISSEELAQSAGVNSAKLRKDLSFLGSHGIRGVGYEVGALTEEISRALGAHRSHRVALVGLGNLGQALAGYPGFADRGFVVSALFDADPLRVGRDIAGLRIEHIKDAGEVCRASQVTIGVIATPASAAQDVAEVLVRAGIRSILNFAPGVLTVPDGVEVRQVDLAIELQILAFHESRRIERRMEGRMEGTADSAVGTADSAIDSGRSDGAVNAVPFAGERQLADLSGSLGETGDGHTGDGGHQRPTALSKAVNAKS